MAHTAEAHKQASKLPALARQATEAEDGSSSDELPFGVPVESPRIALVRDLGLDELDEPDHARGDATPGSRMTMRSHDSTASVFDTERGRSAAIAIWLGILLDGIPESLVLGIMSNEATDLRNPGLMYSLTFSVLISNLPEALVSASTMKKCGMSTNTILLLWWSNFLLSGVGAFIGSLLFPPGKASAMTHLIQAGIEVLFSSSPAHLPPVLLLLLQEGIGTATAAGTSTNAEHPRRRIPLRRRRRTLLLLRMLPRILPMGARPRTPSSSSSSHRDGLGLLERDGLGVIHGRLLRSRGGATARAPALLAASGGTVHRRTHTGLIRLLLLLIRRLAVLRVLALLLLLLLQTVVALGGVRDGRRRRRRGRAPAPAVAPTASTAAGWASTSSWHPRGRRGVGPEGRPLLLLLRLESSSSSAASGRAGAGPGPQHPVALVVRASRVLL